MADISFNLVDEPWIPCTDLDGKYHLLGIRDILLRAHEIRSLQHQNPLSESALLRVLLAVIHRSVEGPRNESEWKGLYSSGKFDNRVSQYLEEWHSHFDLFSEDKPFYQTPGLLVIDKEKKPLPQTISTIVLEQSSGNNKTLFDHTSEDSKVRLSANDAAHALITSQMFSLCGLNKKTTNLFGYQQSYLNSVMVSGIYIVLNGKSLFETLMLNLLIYSDNEPMPNTSDDSPVWERTDHGGTTNTTPRGYLDFLTCKCRHIFLDAIQNDHKIFVEHIHIAQGEAFSNKVTNPGFMNKQKKDGNMNKQKKDGKWYHPQLNLNRLIWRDSIPLFSFDKEIDRRPKVFCQVQSMRRIVDLPNRYLCTAFALANDKANPLAWRKEKLNIPLSLLSDEKMVVQLKNGMTLIEKAGNILWNAVLTYMREYLPNNSKDIKEKVKATGAMTMYWDNMEAHFQRFLLELDEGETTLELLEKSVKQTAEISLKSCVLRRYRNSANSYRAWSAGSAYLNINLAGLNK